MTMNEEFEKWMSDYAADAVTVEMVIERLAPREAAFEGYRQRQPEIDALKAENRGLADLFQKKVDDCAEMEIRMHRENATLQAEVDRLRSENIDLSVRVDALNDLVDAPFANTTKNRKLVRELWEETK